MKLVYNPLGKAVIGKTDITKPGDQGQIEKELPPHILARTGETLRDNKPIILEGMNPGLTDIQASIVVALDGDQVMQNALKQNYKTIGILVPVEHFDSTCFHKQEVKRQLALLGSVFGKKTEPEYTYSPSSSQKGGWRHGDTVFSFSFMGRDETKPDGEWQRMHAAVMIARDGANEMLNMLNTQPHQFFDTLLHLVAQQGVLRTVEGNRVEIDPGERAILLANKQYGGGWDQSYPSANPFPENYKPNT